MYFIYYKKYAIVNEFYCEKIFKKIISIKISIFINFINISEIDDFKIFYVINKIGRFIIKNCSPESVEIKNPQKIGA